MDIDKYIYIYINGIFGENMSEEKEFKIERVKPRYNAHNLPIDVALCTQNKSPVCLKSTINELCPWSVIFTFNQFLLLVFVQACTSA